MPTSSGEDAAARSGRPPGRVNSSSLASLLLLSLVLLRVRSPLTIPRKMIMLTRLTCLGPLDLAHLSWSTRPGSPVLATSPWLTCPGALPLAHLSRHTLLCCLVPAHSPWLTCPGPLAAAAARPAVPYGDGQPREHCPALRFRSGTSTVGRAHSALVLTPPPRRGCPW